LFFLAAASVFPAAPLSVECAVSRHICSLQFLHWFMNSPSKEDWHCHPKSTKSNVLLYFFIAAYAPFTVWQRTARYFRFRTELTSIPGLLGMGHWVDQP